MPLLDKLFPKYVLTFCVYLCICNLNCWVETYCQWLWYLRSHNVYFIVFLFFVVIFIRSGRSIATVGVTVFISLSGLLPNSSCLPAAPSSSLFKLVIVAIKGTWIKVGPVRDNIQVVQTRNSRLISSFRKQTWKLKYHSWLSVKSFWWILQRS